MFRNTKEAWLFELDIEGGLHHTCIMEELIRDNGINHALTSVYDAHPIFSVT